MIPYTTNPQENPLPDILSVQHGDYFMQKSNLTEIIYTVYI